MYPENYYVNERLFRIYPAVVRAGAESILSIFSDFGGHPFEDGTEYEVRFVPKDELISG